MDVDALAKELGIHPRKLEILLLFEKVAGVIIDPDVPGEEVRQRIFRQVPREDLQRAVDELEGGLLDDDDVDEAA